MQNKLDERLVERCFAFLVTVRRAIEERLNPLGKRVGLAVDQGAADLRKRWEESDYDATDALHRLRGQCLIWLFSTFQRWRRSRVPGHVYYLPVLFTLSGLVLMKFVHQAALPILFAAVLLSVRTGGLRAGLLAVFLSTLAIILVARNSFHSPAGSGIVLALLGFVAVSILACILIDSLEIARQDSERLRSEAEGAAHRFRFLAEASAMLEAEYSYSGILSAVTRAIVPAFANWAAADMLQDGEMRRVALSHQDDAVATLLTTAQSDRIITIPEDHPVYEALLHRQARVFANVSDALVAPLQLDCQDARGIKPEHVLLLPLTARNRLLGMLTLISTTPERPFSPADLAAARDLAHRVGMAMDNVRLYHGALYEAAELAKRERETADRKTRLEIERTALVEQNARLAVEATTDGLTGLLNHLTFKRALDQEFQRAQPESLPISVALLDIDRFKSYNDTFGHPAGDEVLRRAASIMRETARGSDIVARYGGEEFVVVMPDTDTLGAVEAIERIRHAIKSTTWPGRAITISAGVSTLHPGISTSEELIGEADRALYESKRNGRNRVTHATVRTEAVVFRHKPVAQQLQLWSPTKPGNERAIPRSPASAE